MSVQHLSHIGICVGNLERSLVFYRDGLGFRERSKLDVSSSDCWIARLSQQIGLIQNRNSAIHATDLLDQLWFEPTGDEDCLLSCHARSLAAELVPNAATPAGSPDASA